MMNSCTSNIINIFFISLILILVSFRKSEPVEMVAKIAVLGGGINGLACAVKIKEKYNHLQVVLISSDFSPNTTGDGSGGLWYPYLCGDTPGQLLSKWGCESYEFLHQLWLKGGHEICLVPFYYLYQSEASRLEPYWSKDVFGYHELNQKELQYLSKLFSVNYVAGHTFSSFIYSASPFLSYLHGRFKNASGETLQLKVDSLQDPILKGFDVIINCTGLGAKYLVPDDAVFPIRGQITKVIAPWIFQSLIDDDSGNYILPNEKTCVLGGTHQEHDYNTNVDEKDTAFILNGCKNIMPSLQSAEIYSHWVGLRPGRHSVRLEAEERNGKLIIHNYGHGRCGLTLFWGCATDVLELLDAHLGKEIKEKCKL